MAQFVLDRMTGTGYANLDIGHSAEAGGPWTRNGDTPSTRWYLFNNRCHCGIEGAVYANGNPSGADYYVEADYVILSDIVGAALALRMSTSALTCYYTHYQSGQVILAKYVNGSASLLGTWSSTLTGTHKLRLTATGTSIVVAVDGTNRITVTDATITGAGKAGLVSAGRNDASTGKHIDNFTATDGSPAGTARSYALGIIGL